MSRGRGDLVALVDLRRRMAELPVGGSGLRVPPESKARTFREEKDRLFRRHPRSPLDTEARERFEGLGYYPCDLATRVQGEVQPVAGGKVLEIELRDDGPFGMQHVACLPFRLSGTPRTLCLYWILGYGGGFFLPLRGATNGRTSYAGGRYLLDTLKHADLGREEGRLVPAFSNSCHPSCADSRSWDCPLAPPENGFDLPPEAGEQL